MGAIGSYFRLRPPITAKAEGGGLPGWLTDALQYIVLLLGIFIQPFFAAYRATGSWNFTGSWGWVLFAVIVGFLIFPAVYKNSFDPNKAILVQLCAIFAAGLGWQTLLQTAGKVANLA